ncbi:aldo/keto reductase [Phenylobacterium sp.]|jgi:aryl-alcohol dehydrogenase-like predicted oxidoreductase|uniref:aldo/keto reductase n=1 Tax=Phenylobacterium sp. TaxID=1871053 RepID=UPI002E347954|nr:aldo/keto reductase [Phenylobacterium sp.]HEX2561798.1 aldo/keto reductase [Phenylobacterium sp.]
MRYRPFGATGKAVSAVSLVLTETRAAPTPQAWRSVLFGAMECGINTFELIAGSETLARGVNEALQAVDRGLLFLTWRICGDPARPMDAAALGRAIRDGLSLTSAAYFDLVMLDEPAVQTLTADAEALLGDLKSAGLVRQAGVRGEGAAVDEAIRKGGFEAFSSPFSLVSDGRTRRRVKDAAEADMAVIAYDAIPAELCRPVQEQQKTAGLLRRRSDPLSGVGTYNFLHETRGWIAEELCLGYALTEPAFATVQIDTLSAAAIERLAGVPERDLPTGVVAQIEMARFGVREAQRA